VAIDNRAAQDATVVDIFAQDRAGLLYALSETLFEQGLEIHLAKIAAEGNRVADAFYVRKSGKKIEDPDALAALEQALRDAARPPG
jgi:[protein-PII] uridylyltransferase